MKLALSAIHMKEQTCHVTKVGALSYNPHWLLVFPHCNQRILPAMGNTPLAEAIHNVCHALAATSLLTLSINSSHGDKSVSL